MLPPLAAAGTPEGRPSAKETLAGLCPGAGAAAAAACCCSAAAAAFDCCRCGPSSEATLVGLVDASTTSFVFETQAPTAERHDGTKWQKVRVDAWLQPDSLRRPPACACTSVGPQVARRLAAPAAAPAPRLTCRLLYFK